MTLTYDKETKLERLKDKVSKIVLIVVLSSFLAVSAVMIDR